MTISKDKWGKHTILKGSKNLVHLLPMTQLLSKRTFLNLLFKYRKIMLKPCNGKLGYGVIQVSLVDNNLYKIHEENNIKICEGIKEASIYLKDKIKFTKYIVQQYIPLISIKGQPMDFRVLIQRKKKSIWKITGMYAKVAQPGYLITNVTEKFLPIRTAVHLSNLKKPKKKLVEKINKIALLTAKRLGYFYPRFRILGLDIGLDEKGKFWIIEANSTPSISHFLRLKDKKMFRAVRTIKKSI